MRTIGICASGASLTLEDCQKIRAGCDEIIAVNDSWRMVTADHLYGADSHWWQHHIHDVNMGFSGKRWSCDPPGNTNWGKRDASEWGITILNCNIGGSGLSKEKGTVVSGGNSGYQAINLALHLGATRIVLLGYDMCHHGNRSHFFGDHPTPLRTQDPRRYIDAFRTIDPDKYGLEILNATRHTALDAFEIVQLEDVI